jgi:hypothetical protein
MSPRILGTFADVNASGNLRIHFEWRIMSISERDFEALSAYLDGELSGKALARLEARLHSNQELQETYEQLQRTRSVIRSLPKIRAPRNYMLTPEMVGVVQKPHRAFPILRFASVLATLGLILVFMGDIFVLPTLTSISSEAVQFAAPAVAEQVQPILEAEIVESQLPEAPAEGEMDRAISEEEAAPPAAAEAMEMLEEAAAPVEKTQILSTLASPVEELADDLGRIAEPEEEPEEELLLEVETRIQESQFVPEERAGFDIETIVRYSEIALLIIALSTGLTAYYLYRRYR